MNLYGIVGASCLAMALMLLAAIKLIYSKKRNGQRELKAETQRPAAFFITLYSRLLLVPLARELVMGIRKRLEVYSNADENSMRKRTVTIFMTSAFLFAGLILLFWVFTRDFLMLILFTVLLSFIGDSVVEIFINNLQNRLLRQQVHYLELLRHKYYEQKSVEDANYEACKELNKKGSFEVYAQAEKINDILASSEVESELERYYETAPNRYLKMLAGIIYITKEYGDTQVQGSSVFIRCITYLGTEIKAELYKREKLKYALKSLNVISILPLFFLKPLRNWAGTSFAPLENFYAGRLGIILGLATVIISVISYMTLRRLQRFDRAEKASCLNKTLEQKLYEMGLYRLVDKLVPHDCTQKKKTLMELIQSAMAPLNIYTLYTRRLLYGSLAFVMGILFIFGLNAYTRHTILYSPQMPAGYLGGKLSEEELKRVRSIADEDRKIILALKGNMASEAISRKLSENGAEDAEAIEASIKRIQEKMLRLKNNIFWWWELILCFFLFLSGFQAPILNLRFLARVRKIDMEEEVSQFQTIILMLMHMNRVHVEELLEWMEMFSVHFKEPLQKCLSNFSSGSFEALEQLKEEAAFAPFISIIDNLQLASEDLGVERAFEELESEMSFNRETRKESNERIVERKKNLGNLIGFLPIYSLIVLYLIIPMIVSGMESISAFFRQLSQL